MKHCSTPKDSASEEGPSYSVKSVQVLVEGVAPRGDCAVIRDGTVRRHDGEFRRVSRAAVRIVPGW